MIKEELTLQNASNFRIITSLKDYGGYHASRWLRSEKS